MNFPKWLMMPVRSIYRNIALSSLAFALLGGAYASGVPDRMLSAYSHWRYERNLTPEAVLRSLRGAEKYRLRVDADKNKNNWLFWSGLSSHQVPDDVLIVMIEGDKATTPSEAKHDVCTLLSPPVNLKQELFSEIQIWNRWKQGTNEWFKRMKDEGCPTGRANEAVCNAYLQLAVARVNIERLRLKLPADPAEICSEEQTNTDARGKTHTVAKLQK